MAPFLALYRKRHPEVDVQLYEHGAARVLEAVARGDVHLEIEALSDQPILTLSRDFITRRTFDAGCESARLHPVVHMESVTASALVAMARAGYGVAIVPSHFVFSKQGVKGLPIVSRGQSLGRQMAIQWDPRRFQPAYVKLLADQLAEFASGSYPGQEYGFAPPLADPSSRGTRRRAARRD